MEKKFEKCSLGIIRVLPPHGYHENSKIQINKMLTTVALHTAKDSSLNSTGNLKKRKHRRSCDSMCRNYASPISSFERTITLNKHLNRGAGNLDTQQAAQRLTSSSW